MIHTRNTKAAIVCMLFCSVTPLRANIPWLRVEGNRIKDPNGNVVVLRGISLIDLGFLEGWQGGAFNMINRLTDRDDSQGSSPGWYPKVLRIPIHPPDSVDSWPYRWDPDDDRFYNGLLRAVVDYCADKDLYVILDWHYFADTWDKVTQTSEFWEYMAPRFANDSHVLFELFNEPINSIGSDTDNWLSVRTDMQGWVDIVRSYAPNNLILVGGPSWSMTIGPAATYPVAGNNIVYVSHLYPAQWLGAWGDRQWYRNQITTCAAVHPVIMTEWGFSQSISSDTDVLLNGTISNYGQPLKDFVERHGISNTAWVASHNWGPPMFNTDWTLRCGEGEMGCFVKDWLYAKRNDDQPYRIPQTPFDLDYLSTEDFETNDFSKFLWSSHGNEGWDTTRWQRNSGSYGAQSGPIEDSGSTTLEVSVDCVSGDITFYRRVSSESCCDHLKFKVDGVQEGSWSGEENWTEVSFPVDEGTRTFEWTYSKDDSVSEGDDTAWIDDIVFPLKIAPPLDPEPPDPDPDTSGGFDLYLDYVAPDIVNSSWLDEGILEYYSQDNPAFGNYCIHWTGVGQYSAISFRFVPVRDLSEFVDEGFAIDFWVRCDSPSARIDIRFVDTKTEERGDHPWRMRYTIDRNVADWNGQWDHLQIPLNAFSEMGSWDDGWFNPIDAYDWTATEHFEIVSEYGDLKGIQFDFDDIRVVDPDTFGRP